MAESATHVQSEQWSGKVPATWVATGQRFQTELNLRSFQATKPAFLQSIASHPATFDSGTEKTSASP